MTNLQAGRQTGRQTHQNWKIGAGMRLMAYLYLCSVGLSSLYFITSISFLCVCAIPLSLLSGFFSLYHFLCVIYLSSQCVCHSSLSNSPFLFVLSQISLLSVIFHLLVSIFHLSVSLSLLGLSFLYISLSLFLILCSTSLSFFALTISLSFFALTISLSFSAPHLSLSLL